MRHWIGLLNQSCRDAARCISDADQRPLSRAERTGMVLHLAICRQCREYRKQIQMIDRILQPAQQHAAAAALAESARARIAKRLSAETPNENA